MSITLVKGTGPAKGPRRVEKGYLVLPSGTLMRMSCRHTKARGACGGCYARLSEALKQIADGHDAKTVVREVFAAMRADR